MTTADLSIRHAELPLWLDRTLAFRLREVVQPEKISVEDGADDAHVSR